MEITSVKHRSADQTPARQGWGPNTGAAARRDFWSLTQNVVSNPDLFKLHRFLHFFLFLFCLKAEFPGVKRDFWHLLETSSLFTRW